MYVITNSNLHILCSEIHDLVPKKIYLHAQKTRPMIYVFENVNECRKFSDMMTFRKPESIAYTNMTSVLNEKKTDTNFDIYSKSTYKTKLLDKTMFEFEGMYNILPIEDEISQNIQEIMFVQNAALFMVQNFQCSESNWLNLNGIILSPLFNKEITNNEFMKSIRMYLDNH